MPQVPGLTAQEPICPAPGTTAAPLSLPRDACKEGKYELCPDTFPMRDMAKERCALSTCKAHYPQSCPLALLP